MSNANDHIQIPIDDFLWLMDHTHPQDGMRRSIKGHPSYKLRKKYLAIYNEIVKDKGIWQPPAPRSRLTLTEE